MAASARSHTDPALYDSAAADWWSGQVRWLRTLQNLVPARLRAFDPVVGDWRGKRGLDLGCAGGFMAEALAARGALVTGLDPATAAVKAGRARSRTTGSRVDYLVGMGEHLPFQGTAFDVVVCVDVLEHVRDLAAVIAEVRRVLRPGGLFLFDTINRNPISALAVVTIAERVLRLLPPGTHQVEGFIRPAELRGLLRDQGFTVGPMVGLGPRGLDRRFDITFGRVPTKAVLYLGHARLGAGAS
jgi:2-polyprenyl-6-hydroxyphenyl methylase/3-demethylubiquinone-9 3-methyltransferase